MDKKAITLEQLEDALRNLTRWIKDKLTAYIAEPSKEGKTGYVLTTNGAGGRSWEAPGGVELDDSLSKAGAAAEAEATGNAVAAAVATANEAQAAAEAAQAAADAINTESIGAEKARLQFENVAVTVDAFVADTTYEDFPYCAGIPLNGVTADMTPEVVLGVAEAMSGIFAPAAESYDGGVYIYSSEVPAASITIPVIILWR